MRRNDNLRGCLRAWKLHFAPSKHFERLSLSLFSLPRPRFLAGRLQMGKDRSGFGFSLASKVGHKLKIWVLLGWHFLGADLSPASMRSSQNTQKLRVGPKISYPPKRWLSPWCPFQKEPKHEYPKKKNEEKQTASCSENSHELYEYQAKPHKTSTCVFAPWTKHMFNVDSFPLKPTGQNTTYIHFSKWKKPIATETSDAFARAQRCPAPLAGAAPPGEPLPPLPPAPHERAPLSCRGTGQRPLATQKLSPGSPVAMIAFFHPLYPKNSD